MPRTLTEAVKSEISELFELYDEELEGTIPVANVVTILRALDYNPSNQYIEHLEKKFNDGFNGRVSLEDMYTICSDESLPAQGPTDEDLKKAFGAFDSDGNGTIDKAELAKALLTMGEAMSNAEVERLFADLDKNDDGKLDYQEFLTVLNPEQFKEQQKRSVDALHDNGGEEIPQPPPASAAVTNSPSSVEASQVSLPDNWHYKDLIKRLTDYAAQKSNGKRWSAQKGEEALAAGGDHSKADLSSTLQDNLKSIDSFEVKVKYAAKGGYRPVVSRFGIQGPPPELEYHQLCMPDFDGTSVRPHGRALDVSSVSAAGTVHWGDCNRTPSVVGRREDDKTDSKVVKSYIDLITPVNPTCFTEDVTAIDSLKKRISGKESGFDSSIMPKPILFLDQTPSSAWKEYCLLALESLGPAGECSANSVDSSALVALVDQFDTCDVYYREETTGYTPLAMAIAVGGSPSLITKLVKERHSVIIHPFSPAESPVHLACEHGTVEQLKAIMDAGGDAFHPSVLSRTYHGHASPLEQVVARTKKGSSSERRAAFFSYLVPLLAPHRSAIRLLPFEAWASDHKAGLADLPKVWASVARECTPPPNESMRYITAGGLLNQAVGKQHSKKKEALIDGLLDVMSHEEIATDRTWQNGTVLHTAASTGEPSIVSLIAKKAPQLLLVVDTEDRFPLTVALSLKKANHTVVQTLLAPTLSVIQRHHVDMIKAGSSAAFRILFWNLVERGLEKEAEELWDMMEVASAIELDWYGETLAKRLDRQSLIEKVLLSCRVDALTFMEFAEIAFASNRGKVMARLVVDEVLRCSILAHKGFQIVASAMRGGIDASLVKRLWDYCIPTDNSDLMEQAWLGCREPSPKSFTRHCFPLIEIAPESFKDAKIQAVWGRSLLQLFSSSSPDFGGLKALFDRALPAAVRYQVLVQSWLMENRANIQEALIQLLQDKNSPPIPGEVACQLMSIGGTRTQFFSGKNERVYTKVFFEHLAERRVVLPYTKLSAEGRSKLESRGEEQEEQEEEDNADENGWSLPSSSLCRAAPCVIAMNVFKDCMAGAASTLDDYVLRCFALNHTPPSDGDFLEDLSIQGTLLSDYKAFLHDAGAVPGRKSANNSGIALLAHVEWQLKVEGAVHTPGRKGGMTHVQTFGDKKERLPASLVFHRIVLEACRSCDWAKRSFWQTQEETDEELNDEEEFSLPKEKTLYPLLLGQRLVQLGASKKHVEAFLFLFPDAAPIVANVASALQNFEVASYALSVVPSSNPIRLLPSTNTAIKLVSSSGTKRAAFVEKCHTVILNKEKKWEITCRDALVVALFSPEVDSQHFEEYIKNLHDAQPEDLASDMNTVGYLSRLSFTVSTLEHYKNLGVGFAPHKAVDPHARYANHWLTTVISDPIGSTVTTSVQGKPVCVQPLIDERKKNFEKKVLNLVKQLTNLNPLMASQLLRLSTCRGLDPHIGIDILKCKALQNLEEESEALNILHEPGQQAWILRTLSSADLKEAIRNNQVSKTIQVAKTILLDDRHRAARPDLLKQIAVHLSDGGEGSLKLAQFAIRHCRTDKEVDIAFEGLGLEHGAQFLSSYARGNKMGCLRKLSADELKAQFGTVLNTLLICGHASAAVLFIKEYDTPDCALLLAQLSDFLGDFKGCNWIGKHLFYSACNSGDPAFYEFVFNPSGPLSAHLTPQHYQLAAYALLRVCRPTNQAAFLRSLVKARSSINQLQDVQVVSLGDEEAAHSPNDDDDDWDGGSPEDPVVCSISSHPGCSLPDDRPLLLKEAGYDFRGLVNMTITDTVALVRMVENGDDISNINIEEAVKMELKSRLEGGSLPSLLSAAQRNTKVRDALVKVAPALSEDQKEKFNSCLPKIIRGARKPSQFLCYLPPLCGSEGFGIEDWVDVVMRAAGNNDKVFFEQMTESDRWKLLPDQLPSGPWRDMEHTEIPHQPLDPVADREAALRGDTRPLVDEVIAGRGGQAVSEEEFKKWATALFIGLPESSLAASTVDLTGASGVTLTKRGLLQHVLSPRLQQALICAPSCCAGKNSSPRNQSSTSKLFNKLFEEFVCNAMSLRVGKKPSLEITCDGLWIVTVGDSSTDNCTIDFDENSHTSEVLDSILHLSTHLKSNKAVRIASFGREDGIPPYSSYHSHTFQTKEGSPCDADEPVFRAIITDNTASKAVWLRLRGLCILLDYYWPLRSDEMLYEYSLQLLYTGKRTDGVRLWEKVQYRATPGASPPSDSLVDLTVVAPDEQVSKQLINIAYKQPISLFPGVRAKVAAIVKQHALGPVLPTDHLDGTHDVSSDERDQFFVFSD